MGNGSTKNVNQLKSYDAQHHHGCELRYACIFVKYNNEFEFEFKHHVCVCWFVYLCMFKDRAHLSTFKIFIFEKFSCFIVLVVFLVIVQSSELVSVWFCEKMTFFPNFFSYHIFAIYVGGASLGLPTACRLIAVSGARLPSVDGLVVRCIKMHHHVKSAITICLQFI